MGYIPYTFCQYLYRHIYIYLYSLLLKGFIPKHTIPFEEKVLNFNKHLIKYISIKNVLVLKKIIKFSNIGKLSPFVDQLLFFSPCSVLVLGLPSFLYFTTILLIF